MQYFKASARDVMGDQWAQKMRQVWEQMREQDPELTSVPGIYNIWQWMHCQVADMQSRVVASPVAMANAGQEIPERDLVDDIIRLSDQVINKIDAESPKVEPYKARPSAPIEEIEVMYGDITYTRKPTYLTVCGIFAIVRPTDPDAEGGEAKKGWLLVHRPTKKGMSMFDRRELARGYASMLSEQVEGAGEAVKKAARSEVVEVARDALQELNYYVRRRLDV